MTIRPNPARVYCLLLGADQTFRDRALLGAARATAMPIAIMQRNAPVARNLAADLVIPGIPFHPEAALDAVQRFEAQTGARPGAVVPLGELTVQPGLAIAEHYGLPYLSRSCIDAARDKAVSKSLFEAAGLPIPAYARFSTREDLATLMAQFAYPVVLKPAQFGGSEGVRLARTPQELDEAYAECVGAMSGAMEQYGLPDNQFVIEEYIDAPNEVSVEVINSPSGRSVIAVTDKYLSPHPYFAEIGHSVPSVFTTGCRIRTVALDACKALGVDRGVAHVELRIRSDGDPVLMEVNARTSGGGITNLVERVTGINLYEMHTWTYTRDDLPPSIPTKPKGRAAIAFLKGVNGRITNLILPSAREIPEDVTSFHFYANPGDLVKKAMNSLTRDGAIEFYWPDDLAQTKTERHLDVAAELSTRLIVVDPER